MISVENLVKKYNGYTALDGLNFTVEDGDIFGFLGPNGAGKTTTIRILTTMIKADSGNVLIDKHNIFREPLMIKKDYQCSSGIQRLLRMDVCLQIPRILLQSLRRENVETGHL